MEISYTHLIRTPRESRAAAINLQRPYITVQAANRHWPWRLSMTGRVGLILKALSKLKVALARSSVSNWELDLLRECLT
ncbi:MAG: hypothetical protein ACRD2O_14495 [Terriglobia bacterium]